MMTLGVDVSHWQADRSKKPFIQFDWQKYAASDAQFCFLRAGYGKYADDCIDYNLPAIQDTGKPFGIYWFYEYRPGVDPGPEAQANRMLEVTKGISGQGGYILDFERPSSAWPELPARSRCIDLIERFYGVLDRAGKRAELFYTNPAGNLHLKPPSSMTTKRKLWVANYQVIKPRVDYWPTWTFWQFTDRLDASKYGAAPACKQIDGNHYNGDEAAMAAFFGSQPPAPPQPEDGVKLKITANVNIRTQPSTTGNAAIGIRMANEEMTATKTFIENSRRVWVKDAKGWSAVVHDGAVFMRGL